MRTTAVYRHDIFLEHNPGAGHPETADRLRVIYEQLDNPEIGDDFFYPSFGPASPETIALNHDKSLIKRVASTAGKTHDFLDADTQTSAKSYEAALMAAGALVDGVDRLLGDEVDNCFALVRPPGHHAEADRSMGFCLFNNVAIAARHVIAEHGLQRIVIVDWDLHHGNGTQHSFYHTDKVLYFSTHQYPYYPGTGGVEESGADAGAGYTVNVPLPGGQDDFAYATVFNRLAVPVIREYRPELILVSCGFDIYQGDPLGAMMVSAQGFAYLTRVMRFLAEELCGGRLLITLEGGYNLTGMRDGGLAVLGELLGKRMQTDLPVHLDESTATALARAQESLLSLEEARSEAKKRWHLQKFTDSSSR